AGGAQQVAGTSSLVGVGCAGSNPATCEAVGGRTTSTEATGTHGVTVQLSSTYAPGAAQTVTSMQGFKGVACNSATSCVAVGIDKISSTDQVGAYTLIDNGVPGGVQTVGGTWGLWAVGCEGAGTCVAGGPDGSGGGGATTSGVLVSTGGRSSVGGG